MSERDASGDVTRLLVQWREGREGALERLLPLVYDQLRRLAARQMRRERPDHTLQPTALINELFLLLVRQRAASAENRAHFFALTAQLMRRILVDHARSRDADKRGGRATMVALDKDAELAVSSGAGRALEVLAIDQALARLAVLDADQARIVELRFFAGLTVEEAALVLDRSPRTVKREWRLAKAWLTRELASLGSGGCAAEG
jgi:RNA polymerase sigma factor (TIGR02999 family)